MSPEASITMFPQANQPVARQLEAIRAGKMAEECIDAMRQPPKRMATGLHCWDQALKGGLMVPSFTVLGAKPKCGKSTIMTYVAANVVSAGNYCYLLDMENGGNRIFRRLIAQRAKIAMDEFFTGERAIGPESTEFARAKKEMTEGGIGQRLYLETERRFNEGSIEEKVSYLSMKARGEGAEFMLIADSLQKLPVASLNDRRAGIDGWLRFFEYLRDRYQIAILVTSELKRPTEGQQYKPTEIAFKESGDVEYSADLAITLDKDSAGDHWIDDPPENNPIECKIIFNRDGPAGRLRKDLLLKYPHHELVEVDAIVRTKNGRKVGILGY